MSAGSKISLCYDTDTTLQRQRALDRDRRTCRPPTAAARYTWNTTGVAPGTYYIAGYMWDGNGPTPRLALTQAITITAAAAQTFALTGPTSGTYAGGPDGHIQWTAANVVAGSTISLCYDTDTTFNGNEHWIEIDGVPAANGSGTYTWNTAGVAPGTYYLGGYMWDGKGPHART